MNPPWQPENCVLSINHKALTHCSSVSWVRQVHFSEKDNGYPLRPPHHPLNHPLRTQTHCHRCRAPPKSHFLLHVALIGGFLVNQSCQNINGSLRITFHASKLNQQSVGQIGLFAWAKHQSFIRNLESVKVLLHMSERTRAQFLLNPVKERRHTEICPFLFLVNFCTSQKSF